MASVNDILADEARIRAINLMRLSADEREKAVKMLRRLQKEIEEQIKVLDPTASKSAAAQKSRLAKLLGVVKETVAKSFKVHAENFTGAMTDLADNEQEWILAMGNAIFGTGLFDAAITPAALKRIVTGPIVSGAPTQEWWSRQSEALIRRFSDQIRLGLLRGDSIEAMVTRIIGGTDSAGNRVPAVIDTTASGAEKLVRASVMSVSNEVRMNVLKENDDVVKGMQWIATLDSRTTALCASLDGLAWTLDGEPIGHRTPFPGPPPLHYNCRSTLGPVLKTFREIGLDAKEMPQTTRASMDGQIPEAITFDKWLKAKEMETPGFAGKMFGKARAKLWNEGKLTLADMAAQKGNGVDRGGLRKANEEAVKRVRKALGR